MTREEQLEQAALNYGHNNPYCYWNDDDLYEEDYESPSQDFKAGAEWADRTMIDNIYDWLKHYLDCYVEVEGEHAFITDLKIHTDLIIEDLKKYLEEQQ